MLKLGSFFKASRAFKIIFWVTLGILLLFSITPRGYAQNIETEEPVQTFPYTKKFVISSYYTPLPGQAHYFRGNYEADVRLNGEGRHAADGTAVYPGLAAAPKNFPFGTKMNIPGFGIVAIHDRGGAIRNNRLDVWVGSGEEGLRRALGWGMRTIEVTVYGVDPSIQELVSFDEIPLADISSYLPKSRYFMTDLAMGDEGEEVRELQRFLKRLGYLNADTTGFFGEETHAAVQNFQLAAKVIEDASDTGAGNFGPRTRVALESALANGKASALGRIPSVTLAPGTEGEAVTNLQSILKEFGFLHDINGKFDESMKEALVRFQTDRGLIDGSDSHGAGFYGPRTQTALEDMVKDAYTPFLAAKTVSHAAPASASPLVAQNVFLKQLALEDRGEDVRVLQEELKRLNFFGLEPTGYYGKTTEHAVFKFQQAFGIVKDERETGAGAVGPQTLQSLNTIAFERQGRQKLIAETMEKKEIIASRLHSERLLAMEVGVNQLFQSTISYGMRGGEIETLQRVLKRLGFFPGRLTTQYFGDITQRSLIAFQKSHGLDESGTLDDRTRRVLNTIISPSQPS